MFHSIQSHSWFLSMPSNRAIDSASICMIKTSMASSWRWPEETVKLKVVVARKKKKKKVIKVNG